MPSFNGAYCLFIVLVIAVALADFIAVGKSVRKSAQHNPPAAKPAARARSRVFTPSGLAPEPAPQFAKKKLLTAAEPTQPAVATKSIAVNLSATANRDFLTEFRRDARGPEGIPEDGRVPVPGVVPRAFFQLSALNANNAIVLSAKVTLAIPEKQRGKYEQIAFLHGGQDGGGPVRVTLHFAGGADQTLELQVLNWNTKNRREKPNANEYAAVQMLGADGRINTELFSQTFDLDAERILESITFEPAPSAAIFGVTLIPAE